MNPTSRQLIEAVAEVLRTRIAPLLADQPWPSSELRSMDAILAHLAARVENERDALVADNAELDNLLAELAAASIPVDAPAMHDGSLHASNIARREVLEGAIHKIHDGSHPDQISALRAYLVRSAARDQTIYGPFSGRTLF